MQKDLPLPASIDEYISGFPITTQKLLQQIRITISKAAPDAEEAIGYGIPTFKLKGNLVHFGGYQNHIGFYPGPLGIAAFEEELAAYKTGKGTLQFPSDQPMPLDVITKIVQFRVQQNLAKAAAKAKRM